MTQDTTSTYDIVTDYYGRQLQGTSDLKTSACCDISNMPACSSLCWRASTLTCCRATTAAG